MDEKQRRKHHCIIPIVYPAGTAAFILHKPGLERTEKQDADDIAYGIDAAQQDHDSVIQHPGHMQSAKDPIKNDPDQRDQDCGIIIRNGNFRLAGFHVIARKLLLAARAFPFGREEAKNHFHDKNCPGNQENSRELFNAFQHGRFSEQSVPDIAGQKQNKQHRSVEQANIMQCADNTDTPF